MRFQQRHQRPWPCATCATRVALAAALVAGMGLPAWAAGSAATSSATTERGAASATKRPGASQADYRALRASTLIGMSVRNRQGQNIGQIRDMVINMNTGGVQYAVLQFDPGVFEGEKLYAVPTRELRMARDRDDIVYDIRREQLARAGVDRSQWENRQLSPGFFTNLDRLWGARAPTPNARAYNASDLIGQNVVDRNGENIGEMEDLVVDMANQRVHYAVMEFDPSWAQAGRNYALPLRVFELGRDRDQLVLNMEKSQLQAMSGFNDERYSRLNDPGWRTQVDRMLAAITPDRDQRQAANATESRSEASAGPSDEGSVSGAGTSRAGSPALKDALQQVNEAVQVVQRMKADPRMAGELSRAKGVFIVPDYGRGALGVGLQAGQGVLVRRTGDTFSNPVFYNLGGVSIGAQAGAAGGEIAMLLMTDKALREFESGRQFSINADADLTIVDWSKRAHASTGKVQDVIVWSSAEGVFAGASVGISDVMLDREANRAYYGREGLTPQQILQGQVQNPRHNVLGKVLGV